MASKIDLVARALIELGEKPIADLEDGTDVSNIVINVYDGFKQFILSKYNWSFTLKRVQLARLSTAPVFGYKYSFQIPSDCLNIIAVYDSAQSGVDNLAFQDWQKTYQQIESNAEALWLLYQCDVSETDFPAYFQEAFIMCLAEKLCMAITDKESLKNIIYLKAWGNPADNMNGGLFGSAKNIDSKQLPNKVIGNNTLVASRFAGV